MLTSKHLDKGSCIGIYSPSEPIVESRVERLEQGCQMLVKKGFRVKYGLDTLAHRYYMAGTVSQRVSALRALLEDPEVDGLLSSWGGKSCNQLLGQLPYGVFASARKPLLGFSDICVLQNAVTAKTGLVTFYGPNVAGKLDETLHTDLSILTTDFYADNANILGDIDSVPARVLREGRVQGRLLGGNLSTFVLGVVGTRYCPDPDGGVFFWESGWERPQILDQYLTYLQNSGFLGRIGGMVVGDFVAEEPDGYKDRDHFEMLEEAIEGYDFPVLYCPTFGHRRLENPILPIGALVDLDTADGSLTLLEPVVS